MASIPRAAVDHYREMQRLQVEALRLARAAWRRVEPRFLSESWSSAVRSISPRVVDLQVRAATAGSSYTAATLAEQGSWVAPDGFVDPQAFGGYAADGRSLTGLLYGPVISTKEYIGGGMATETAMVAGRKSLETIVRTMIADAGRQAAGVDTAARRGTGYVRMLNPPSCSRCVVLAGKFFRYNQGFLRHPRCDCVHIASRLGSTAGARAEGLVDDPYAYFHSLSAAEQDAAWGRANAGAIREGADLYQVTNARRGRNGLFTTEGTTRRGNAYGLAGRRLTPEGIYAKAGSREETLRLLTEHGYILPGGQTPGGVLRGTREGFGALGRGGRRVGARAVVEEARRTGVRNGSRYTMTAAERRVVDSEQRYLAVLEGRNPFDRQGRGLTPTISAQVETDYRRWLASGGQIFLR